MYIHTWQIAIFNDVIQNRGVSVMGSRPRYFQRPTFDRWKSNRTRRCGDIYKEKKILVINRYFLILLLKFHWNNCATIWHFLQQLGGNFFSREIDWFVKCHVVEKDYYIYFPKVLYNAQSPFYWNLSSIWKCFFLKSYTVFTPYNHSDKSLIFSSMHHTTTFIYRFSINSKHFVSSKWH